MITVNCIEDVVGQIIRDEGPYVKVLSMPRFENGEWTAVAQVDGSLCLISLSITPHLSPTGLKPSNFQELP